MQTLDIHPKKVQFLNGEAIRVAALLKRLDEVPDDRQDSPLVGSFAHVDGVDLGKMDGPIIYKSYDSISKGRVTAIKSCEGTVCIGYDNKGYTEFLKLVSATYKEKAVNESVSEDLVSKAAFSWLVKYYAKEITDDYDVFLSNYIEERTDSYRVYFPIINLHINNFFRIGNTEFIYFTKDYLKKITEAVTHDNPNYPDPSIVAKELKRYKGQVFASCVIRAEKDKAIELALRECSISIDVLKACSRTTLEPEETAEFDIDSRVKFTKRSEVLSTKSYDISEFVIAMNVTQFPYHIDKIEWDRMLELGLKNFSDFLLNNNEKSELRDLIISSITRYSSALAQRDTHQRVVELYTILESLLLKDENSPIIDSVAKYLVMLVEKGKEARYACANHVRSMYKVRSSLIHHAKRIDFSSRDLKRLQLYVFTLLQNLIIKSQIHKHKRDVLTEIDDKLMSAY